MQQPVGPLHFMDMISFPGQIQLTSAESSATCTPEPSNAIAVISCTEYYPVISSTAGLPIDSYTVIDQYRSPHTESILVLPAPPSREDDFSPGEVWLYHIPIAPHWVPVNNSITTGKKKTKAPAARRRAYKKRVAKGEARDGREGRKRRKVKKVEAKEGESLQTTAADQDVLVMKMDQNILDMDQNILDMDQNILDMDQDILANDEELRRELEIYKNNLQEHFALFGW